MRTATVEIFNFNELDEKAKEKAREWYRDGMNEDFTIESAMITDSMKCILIEEKFELDEDGLQWNLSNSQGDYVGLDGKINQLKLHGMIMDRLDAKEKKWYKILAVDSYYIDVSHKVSYHHYYGQQYDVDIDFDLDKEEYPIIFALYEKVHDIADEIIKDEVNELRSKLKLHGYNEIDFFYSDEHIDDVLDVNGYEFEKDGTHYA